jgi:hypothetical protein
MIDETLSDDIREVTDMEIGCDYLAPKDVKERITKAQSDILKAWNHWTDLDMCNKNPMYTEFMENIDSIFKDNFGDALLGVEE